MDTILEKMHIVLKEFVPKQKVKNLFKSIFVSVDIHFLAIMSQCKIGKCNLFVVEED